MGRLLERSEYESAALRLGKTADRDQEEQDPGQAPGSQLIQELQVHRIELEMQNEELRATQADLARTHDRFRTFFQQSPVGYVVLGASGLIREVNQTFARMVQRTGPELAGKAFFDLVEEPERGVLIARFRAIFRSPEGKSVDVRLIAGDNLRIHARLEGSTLTPVPDHKLLSGEEILVAVINVTAEKAAERALRQSEEQYRLLIDNSQDVVFTVSQEGVLTFASPSWRWWLGHDPTEVVGHHMAHFLLPEDVLVWEAALSRAFESGEREIGVEYRVRHADGSTRWHLTNLAPVYDPGSRRVTACVANARDLSERKRSEEETRRLQGQLHQAMKMEAMGRLAGGVAHDFNNLLTSVTCNVSMALLDLSPEHPLRPMLKEIGQAADSAADLTRHLLAFSRKQVLEPKVVRLDALVTNVQKMLSRLIGEDVILETHHAEGLHSVKADPRQIEQILVNLAINARDAMPGGGKLLIETSNLELGTGNAEVGPGSYVLLRVVDSGHGMSEDVKRHLFEPFFTTKPRGRGTGLGLATIYGIVRQAGGAIEIDSAEGEGTTVRILFPTTKEPCDHPAKEPWPAPLEHGSETILLVEDEGLVRKLGTRILTKLGYRVLAAANAAEALELVDANPNGIDLLFTDIIMPGMSGRDLADQVRSRLPSVRVLYTSGYTENVILERGLMDQGVRYLSKPYAPQTLARCIREALG